MVIYRSIEHVNEYERSHKAAVMPDEPAHPASCVKMIFCSIFAISRGWAFTVAIFFSFFVSFFFHFYCQLIAPGGKNGPKMR
jgi:hypothetical protein